MPRQTREEAVAFAQRLCALQTKDLQFQVGQGLLELDRRNEKVSEKKQYPTAAEVTA
jgi:hypothetical protein